jgi:tetratricopeptide (TPR) repeat protein
VSDITSLSNIQTASDLENEGNSCFLSFDYENAVSFYNKALCLSQQDNNSNLSLFIKFRLCLCYCANASTSELSARFQQKSKEIVVNDCYWLYHLRDGQIFQNNGNHLESLKLFDLSSKFVQSDIFTSPIAALYMIDEAKAVSLNEIIHSNLINDRLL